MPSFSLGQKLTTELSSRIRGHASSDSVQSHLVASSVSSKEEEDTEGVVNGTSNSEHFSPTAPSKTKMGEDNLSHNAEEGVKAPIPNGIAPEKKEVNFDSRLNVEYEIAHETEEIRSETAESEEVEEIPRKIEAQRSATGFEMTMEQIVQKFVGPGSMLGVVHAEGPESNGGLDEETSFSIQAYLGPSKKALAKEKLKWTPLHLAASAGNILIVKTLLSHGAEVDSREDDQWTPLHLAAQNGHFEIVKELLAHKADKDALTDGGRTPLFQASGNGHLEIVKELLAHNADPNAKTDNLKTPLFMAALEDGSSEVIRVLVNAGADVNHAAENDVAPLHLAAIFSYLENIKALLAAKANVNIREYELWTPLHFVAHLQRAPALETITALIDAGAEINARTNGGSTALHLAARSESPAGEVGEIVEYLISRGANKEARDNHERTPIFEAVSKGSLEVINILANAGADVEVVDDDQMNLLHVACARGDIDIVERLIKLGVDVNATTPKKFLTPLKVAVHQGSVEMVNILLENKANPC